MPQPRQVYQKPGPSKLSQVITVKEINSCAYNPDFFSGQIMLLQDNAELINAGLDKIVDNAPLITKVSKRKTTYIRDLPLGKQSVYDEIIRLIYQELPVDKESMHQFITSYKSTAAQLKNWINLVDSQFKKIEDDYQRKTALEPVFKVHILISKNNDILEKIEKGELDLDTAMVSVRTETSMVHREALENAHALKNAKIKLNALKKNSSTLKNTEKKFTSAKKLCEDTEKTDDSLKKKELPGKVKAAEKTGKKILLELFATFDVFKQNSLAPMPLPVQVQARRMKRPADLAALADLTNEPPSANTRRKRVKMQQSNKIAPEPAAKRTSSQAKFANSPTRRLKLGRQRNPKAPKTTYSDSLVMN